MGPAPFAPSAGPAPRILQPYTPGVPSSTRANGPAAAPPVDPGPGRRTVRPPKVAEMVADDLRRRILSGRLRDGSLLATQDELLAEFNVSRASIREALRILESQGLITVRRGKVGGAVVHVPGAEVSAYTLALCLETGDVPIEDVGDSLRHLEAACAARCATSADRRSIAAALDALNNQAEVAVEDWSKYVAVTAAFHERIVLSCGSQTLALVVGAVESLWLSHVRAWATEVAELGAPPSQEYRAAGIAVHRQISDLIRNGKANEVAVLVAEHVDPRQFTPSDSMGKSSVRSLLLKP
jgi:GntR family transcriptional repressor for pyruvate dehydrogenase complex